MPEKSRARPGVKERWGDSNSQILDPDNPSPSAQFGNQARFGKGNEPKLKSSAFTISPYRSGVTVEGVEALKTGKSKRKREVFGGKENRRARVGLGRALGKAARFERENQRTQARRPGDFSSQPVPKRNSQPEERAITFKHRPQTGRRIGEGNLQGKFCGSEAAATKGTAAGVEPASAE